MVNPSHLVIPVMVIEIFHSKWRDLWMWRAGAVLFPYCSFPEKGQPRPTTLNISNRHLAIFFAESKLLYLIWKRRTRPFLWTQKSWYFMKNNKVFLNKHTFNQPARHIQRSLHCEWTISVTMAGITKWLGHTILRLHSYNWFKFEDLTPTGSVSRELQERVNYKR